MIKKFIKIELDLIVISIILIPVIAPLLFAAYLGILYSILGANYVDFNLTYEDIKKFYIYPSLVLFFILNIITFSNIFFRNIRNKSMIKKYKNENKSAIENNSDYELPDYGLVIAYSIYKKKIYTFNFISILKRYYRNDETNRNPNNLNSFDKKIWDIVKDSDEGDIQIQKKLHNEIIQELVKKELIKEENSIFKNIIFFIINYKKLILTEKGEKERNKLFYILTELSKKEYLDEEEKLFFYILKEEFNFK